MNVIKYLAILFALFLLGLGLLGAFNPEMEVEVEEEIVASVSKTWDICLDTSTWDAWKTKEMELEWINGWKDDTGTSYRITSPEGSSFVETVTRAMTDSLLVLSAEYDNGLVRSTELVFRLGNGRTLVKEKQIWKAPDFLQNVQLNFNKSSIVKERELALERLKKYIEKGESSDY